MAIVAAAAGYRVTYVDADGNKQLDHIIAWHIADTSAEGSILVRPITVWGAVADFEDILGPGEQAGA